VALLVMVAYLLRQGTRGEGIEDEQAGTADGDGGGDGNSNRSASSADSSSKPLRQLGSFGSQNVSFRVARNASDSGGGGSRAGASSPGASPKPLRQSGSFGSQNYSRRVVAPAVDSNVDKQSAAEPDDEGQKEPGDRNEAWAVTSLESIAGGPTGPKPRAHLPGQPMSASPTQHASPQPQSRSPLQPQFRSPSLPVPQSHHSEPQLLGQTNQTTQGHPSQPLLVSQGSLNLNQGGHGEYEKRFDPNTQRPYWFHRASGQSSWNPPPGWIEPHGRATGAEQPSGQPQSQSQPQPQGHSSRYEQRFDPATNRSYWFDKQLGTSSWNPPQSDAGHM